jgi:hypothetical protein
MNKAPLNRNLGEEQARLDALAEKIITIPESVAGKSTQKVKKALWAFYDTWMNYRRRGAGICGEGTVAIAEKIYDREAWWRDTGGDWQPLLLTNTGGLGAVPSAGDSVDLDDLGMAPILDPTVTGVLCLRENAEIDTGGYYQFVADETYRFKEQGAEIQVRYFHEDGTLGPPEMVPPDSYVIVGPRVLDFKIVGEWKLAFLDELLLSIFIEPVDWVLTARDIIQGDYWAAIGFIPGLPRKAGEVFERVVVRLIKKIDWDQLARLSKNLVQKVVNELDDALPGIRREIQEKVGEDAAEATERHLQDQIEQGKKALSETAEEIAEESAAELGEGFTEGVIERTHTPWRIDNTGPARTTPWGYHTLVPESFDLYVGDQKYYVHPNATKHMAETASRGKLIGSPSPDFPISILAAAVEEAEAQGLNVGKHFGIFGSFELGIEILPNGDRVIYHAVYKGGP